MNGQLFSVISLVLNLLLGGGLVATWFKYKISNRTANRADFEAITEELRKQRNEAFDHVDRQDVRLKNLEVEIQGLRIARDLDPFPNWLVDLGGFLTFVNRPFEQHFLEPQGKTYRDVVGHDYETLWPEKFCKALKSLAAVSRERPDGIARAITSLDVPSTGPAQITVHQLPVRVRGVVVAYAGYITSIEPDMDKVGWQTPKGKAIPR